MESDARRPRVTVLIPTFNRSAWLGGAIESALAQTYADLAVLVADNASTDGTLAVVSGFDDPRVRSVRRPENIGLVENHNRSLELVDTEYVIVLPDDDRLYPHALATLVSLLDAHPAAGMAHSRFDFLGPNGEIVKRDVDWTVGLTRDTVERGTRYIRESMKWTCRVCPPVALMRRAALPSPLFDPDDYPAVDAGLWLRMALDWDMAFAARTLGAYRIHADSQSGLAGCTPTVDGQLQGVAVIERIKEVKLRFLERHGGRLPDQEDLRRLALWSNGKALASAAPRARDRLRLLASAAVGAARIDPRMFLRAGAWRLAAASLVGPRVVGRLRAVRP